jgi:hypothetical protein
MADAKAKAKADPKAKAKADAKAKAKAEAKAEASDPKAEAADPKAKAKGKSKAKAKPKVTEETQGEEDLAMQLFADDMAEANKQEEADIAEKKAKAERDARVKPPEKIWVTIHRVENGDENKLLLSNKIDTSELRKAISKFSGVPMLDLVIEIDGHEWVEARECPLEKFNPQTQVVKWIEADRVKRVLRKRGLATINNLDKFERSALHFTIIDGDVELSKEIVDHPEFKFSLINKQDVFGDTGLHYACILGYVDIVELMLDKQANPDMQNIHQRTPTMLAAEHGHSMAIRSLIRDGANPGPNPGNCWKYPSAQGFAKLNGRHNVTKEINAKKLEEQAMAELEAQLAAEEEAEEKKGKKDKD